MERISHQRSTVTAAAQAFATPLRHGQRYLLSADVDLYYDIGSDPTATSGHLDIAGQLPPDIHVGAAQDGQTLRVIKKTGMPDGEATLSLVR